jgi:hypothetical protein
VSRLSSWAAEILATFGAALLVDTIGGFADGRTGGSWRTERL